VFAKCQDDSFWVSLVEKAWAKVHGSYNCFRFTVPLCDASKLLNGVPSKTFYHGENDHDKDLKYIKNLIININDFKLFADTRGKPDVQYSSLKPGFAF